MPEDQEKTQKDFMVEKIKQRPINKKKLIRRTLTTAFMAVMFGTIACVTFLFLEPIISNHLNPPEEPKPQPVVFPETEEEILPEDMLSESKQPEKEQPPEKMTEKPEQDNPEEPHVYEEEPGNPEEVEPRNVEITEDQIQEILERVVFDKENYTQLYSSLQQYVREINPYLVTITGVSSNKNWFNDVQESQNQVSGLVLANNGSEVLIITDYTKLQKAEMLNVAFYNNVVLSAYLKQYDKYTGLAVLAVKIEDFPDNFPAEDVQVAELAFGSYNRYVGMPVVALGSPMGTAGSIGYGMINAISGQMTNVDTNYKLLQTNIAASSDASGILFNMQGQVVGLITSNRENSDLQNLICAYSLMELRTKIQKLTNQEQIAYFGITGLDVTAEAHANFGVPFGAYVKKVEMDSPAMLAGIRQGDVIIKMGTAVISNYSDYIKQLLSRNPEEVVEISIMRQNQTEYIQLDFSVTLE